MQEVMREGNRIITRRRRSKLAEVIIPRLARERSLTKQDRELLYFAIQQIVERRFVVTWAEHRRAVRRADRLKRLLEEGREAGGASDWN